MDDFVRARLSAEIRDVADMDEAAGLAAGLLSAALDDAISRRSYASLAVCGGRTPSKTLERLGRADLAWSSVGITLTDERWASPDRADSNEGLVRRHLMTGPAASARFAPMWSSLGMEEGLTRYRALVGGLPDQLDAVLIGMGEDGHIASLFPGARQGLDPDARERCIAVAPQGDPPLARLSLTLSYLIEARRLVLLTSGEAKRSVLRQVLGTPADPTRFPVAALLAWRPDTVILHAP